MESKNGLTTHRINHVQIMKDVKAASIVSNAVDVGKCLGSLKVLAHPALTRPVLTSQT